MQELLAKYEKEFGYKPSYHELYSLYTQGALVLTDAQENELVKLAN